MQPYQRKVKNLLLKKEQLNQKCTLISTKNDLIDKFSEYTINGQLHSTL